MSGLRLFSRLTTGAVVCFALGLSCCNALAKTKQSPSVTKESGNFGNYPAEARLIDIYKLIAAAKHQEALKLAGQLANDYPHFQLGQLVYGDLLTLKTRPIKTIGDVPAHLSQKPAQAQALTELREEAMLRIVAITQRPPVGTIPVEFLKLANRNKHAIAVDVTKSRLYLFEHKPDGLSLVADYYISIGKSGFGKSAEGDLRTPLGVYYVTSRKDPKELAPLYGGGALPINYPNPLDIRMGKTGSGIWLHGTPPERYARPPKSTDGCVVLANPDLQALLAKIAIKTTPVVISQQLQWVKPTALELDRKQFLVQLDNWRKAKSSGQLEQLKAYYQDDFSHYGKNLQDWWPQVVTQVKQAQGREVQLIETSLLQWRGENLQKSSPIMVVTYDEALPAAPKKATRQLIQSKRQYWMQRNGQWRIFFEGPVQS